MRPFRFRLETVRQLRDDAEQNARRDLARQLAEREARAGALVESHDALSAAYAAASVFNPAVAACAEAFVERRERERAAAVTALAYQEAAVDRSRAEAVEASRGLEVVTRLESRQRAAWNRDMARAADAELGELSINAHRRARRFAS
ncbi:MAG: hypothetical protein U0R50_16900 [Gaiellales bacterium]